MDFDLLGAKATISDNHARDKLVRRLQWYSDEVRQQELLESRRMIKQLQRDYRELQDLRRIPKHYD